MESPKLPEVRWMIVYDDQDKEAEYFTDIVVALYRLDQLSFSWNCHLFMKIKSA